MMLCIIDRLGLGYSSETSASFRDRTPLQKGRSKLIKMVHDVCTYCRNMIPTAELRHIMSDEFVSVLIDQKTRWSSIKNMVERFLRILVHLQAMSIEDGTLAELMPNAHDITLLRDISTKLNDMDGYCLMLQSRSINIADARSLFDSLINKYGAEFKDYLGDEANIILNPCFDNALKNLCLGDVLTVEDKVQLAKFKVPEVIIIDDDDNEEVDITDMPDYLRVLEESRKRQRCSINEEYDVDYVKNINPTSCDVERFWSSSSNTMQDIR
jgi:hypothetical protein